MSLQDAPSKLRPFIFHGVDLDFTPQRHPTQAIGSCPFCEKDDHLYVNKTTGQWDCKRCSDGGNIATFLTQLYSVSRSSTTEAVYKELSAERGIPVYIIKAWGLCVSFIRGKWLIPAHNPEGALANLYIWEEAGAFSTPECTHHLLGGHPQPAGQAAKEAALQVITANTAADSDSKSSTSKSPKSKPIKAATSSQKNQESSPDQDSPDVTTSSEIDSIILPGLNKEQKTIWVQEGIWDAMAWDAALQTIKIKKVGKVKKLITTSNPLDSLRMTNAVVACPGSGTFKPEWVKRFKEKDVKVCFDNDYPKKNPKTGKESIPGYQGAVKAATMIAGVAECCEMLKWGQGGYTKKLPDGFDIRDLVKRDGPARAYAFIAERLTVMDADNDAEEAAEQEEIEPLERSTFAELIQDYKDTLHITQELTDCLVVALAVVLSTTLRDEQLWLRFIGPPGSGKSTIAEALSVAREFCFPKSVLTGFHSGFTGGSGGRKKDASVIPKMNGKCVIMKDADTLVSAKNRDLILSELRDIYDGTSRSQYRNKLARDYENIRTTFILCGTDDLRTLNRSFLGDRFLDLDILGKSDTKPYVTRAMKTAYSQIIAGFQQVNGEDSDPPANQLIKRATYGFLQYKKANLTSYQPPAYSAYAQEHIMALGQFLSFMRARVRREVEELGYRPRVELATRLVKQLTKLAICVAFVLDKEDIDEEVIRITKKVTTDTAIGFQQEITSLLHKHQDGLSHRQLALSLQLPETSIRRTLHGMAELGLVCKKHKPNNSGIRGRDLHVWELTKQLRRLCDSIGLNPPKVNQVTNGPVKATKPSGPTKRPAKAAPAKSAKPKSARPHQPAGVV